MNEAYGLRALQQENIHLKEENRRLSEQLSQLRHAIRALNILDKNLDEIGPQTDAYGLINGILMAAIQAVRAEEGSLILLDEEAQELAFADVVGKHRDRLIGTRMPKNEGIVGMVVHDRTPLLVEDVRQESHWYAQVDQALGFETRTLLCVPVFDGTRVWGAIELVNKRDEGTFDEEDQDIMILVARLAGLALSRAEQISSQDGS